MVAIANTSQDKHGILWQNCHIFIRWVMGSLKGQAVLARLHLMMSVPQFLPRRKLLTFFGFQDAQHYIRRRPVFHHGERLSNRQNINAIQNVGRHEHTEKQMVRFTGEVSNQVFAELAHWEQVLKDTTLARQAPPSP